MRDDQFEIDGVLYERIPQEEFKPRSKAMARLMMFAAMSGALDGLGVDPEFESEVIREVRLIKEKKSKKSARERGFYLYHFEKMFRKVEQNKNEK